MTLSKVTINSRKFDRTISRSWACDVVETAGDLLICEGRFETQVDHPELGVIRKGTISREYYWFDRWYNIFRFQEPDGSLRNFYCNIAMPPRLSESILDYLDLDIDVVIWPDHRCVILDRDEFVQNSLRFGYPKEVIQKVNESLQDLRALIDSRQFPFDTAN